MYHYIKMFQSIQIYMMFFCGDTARYIVLFPSYLDIFLHLFFFSFKSLGCDVERYISWHMTLILFLDCNSEMIKNKMFYNLIFKV